MTTTADRVTALRRSVGETGEGWMAMAICARLTTLAPEIWGPIAAEITDQIEQTHGEMDVLAEVADAVLVGAAYRTRVKRE